VTKADAAASKTSKQVTADKKAEAAAQLAITTAKNRAAAALDAEKNAALQMAAAQRQVASAQQAAASAATALAQAYSAASKALDGMSQAAVQNRGDLIQQVADAEAIAKNYQTGVDGAEKYRKKLLELRAQIIQQAVDNGANRAEVTKYVDKLLTIPKKASTRLELDAAKALKDLTALKKLIADIVAGAKINAGIADRVFLSGERGTSGVAGHNAGGTEDWRGGWSWVGEHGPELLNLPAHSKVKSNADSMAAFRLPSVADMAGRFGAPAQMRVPTYSPAGGSSSSRPAGSALANGNSGKSVHIEKVDLTVVNPVAETQAESTSAMMERLAHSLSSA
jgi:ribosomal protein L17